MYKLQDSEIKRSQVQRHCYGFIIDFNIKSYDILAIQELWRNNFTPTTHHPLKDSFRLYYPGLDKLEEKARVCYFVNKWFNTRAILWHWPPIHLYGSTYNQHYIHVHNLYNEPGTSNSPVLDELTSILSQTPATANNLPYKVTTDHIIVRDFNIHHPSWVCKTAQAGNWAPQLLKLIDKFNLTQHLPNIHQPIGVGIHNRFVVYLSGTDGKDTNVWCGGGSRPRLGSPTYWNNSRS